MLAELEHAVVISRSFQVLLIFSNGLAGVISQGLSEKLANGRTQHLTCV